MSSIKIKKFEDEGDWILARRTKITSTKLKNIYSVKGKGEKKGFYELIAERLALPRPEGENKLQRGHDLESEAIELANKELKKTFIHDLTFWQRKDNESIAVTPDAYLEDLTEAIEVKCLSSADHIKAVILKKYPDEYKYQVYQYFIVNDDLRILHFVMYDPSLSVRSYIRFEIKRQDIEEEISKFKKYEEEKLRQVNDIVNQLSF